MIIKVKNTPGLKLPLRANPSDSCYDIFATDMQIKGNEVEQGVYNRIDYIRYDTNLHIQPQPDIKRSRPYGPDQVIEKIKKFDTLIYPRSSIGKTNLILSNSVGTVDAGFLSDIFINFKYISQPQDFVFKNGEFIGVRIDKERIYKINDRVAQMRPTRVYDVDFQLVEELESTDRGTGGFGSSGT